MPVTFPSRLSWFFACLFLPLPFHPAAADLPTASVEPQTIAQNERIKAQGTEIRINGRQFPAAWTQWQQGTSLRTGIGDTAAIQVLGLELLNTERPDLQPARWFWGSDSGEITLKAHFLSPYRYLDLTDLLQGAGASVQVSGNSLSLNFPPSQIAAIRTANQSWGKRIVVDLDSPAAWQVSQAKGEGVVMVAATVNPSLGGAFPPTSASSRAGGGDEDDLGSPVVAAANTSLFSLESAGGITKIRVNLPTAHGLHSFSLANPYRLVIDVRRDALPERRIAWAEGLTWNQQYVRLGQSLFPVNWLEVNLKSPRIALKPIASNPNGREGIAPLVSIARSWQAVAAINGGFFNRNNKLPLGAIRQDSRWLSGPILNRGAIAWNDRGGVKIGRLSLGETVVAAGGQRFPVSWLNSAYVSAGMARYTRDWGATYQTMTDGETAIAVEGGRVVSQFQAEKAGADSLPIPAQGYLLVIRKNAVPKSALAVGTALNLTSSPIPADFADYPHILGAGPLLLQNRQLVLNGAAEQFSKAFQQQRASRSAVATTARGTLILAAAHNRVGGAGASLGEMAQIMQQLGAVDALNLDGGSSTSLVLGGQLIDRSPVTAARVHNGLGIFMPPALLK